MSKKRRILYAPEFRRQMVELVRAGRTFGIVGLAPYWFEVELFGAVSDNGRHSVRVEAETDLFVTQRLILQPLVLSML